MKVPIKFRGRNSENGRYVYGDLITWDFQTGTEFSIRFLNPDADEYIYTPVDPVSITQFVGYDAEGKEIYEGDAFVWGGGYRSVAKTFNNLCENGILKEGNADEKTD